MAQDHVAWLLVTGSTGLVGVVSAGDIVRRALSQGKPWSACQVSEIMTLGVICCRDSDMAMTALRLMNDHRVHQLGVLDATARLSGVTMARDLIAAILTPDSAPE